MTSKTITADQKLQAFALTPLSQVLEKRNRG